MNYLDGGFVFEDVYQMARERRGAKITINWIPATADELFGFPPRVRNCVLAYRTELAEYLKRHSIDVAALIEFRTEVYVAENFRMYVRAYVLDNRKKEHIAYVWN
ncbi:hypothetical protein [Janthinobacterium sp. LB3P118]|uniref:hypothetical protein n=1 Tax=Janthinobacterium sp. LB3P118 TaxID=3424195 RepID=UPI003F210DA4